MTNILNNALFGMAAVVALTQASQTSAADLGVLTTMEVCDTLGISGMSISSATNCLSISGEVEYSFSWGDYDTDRPVVNDLAYAGSADVFIGDGELDWESTVESWLKIVGTAESDFGPAKTTIKFEGTDEVVFEDLEVDEETHEWIVDEAYGSVGDNTVLMAGLKDSIFNDDDDTAFTYQEMFNEDEASGVDFNADSTDTDIDDGGHSIQLVSDLGNGFTVGAGLEDLDDLGTAVGIVQYLSDDLTAHVSVLADELLEGSVNDWAVHAGATATIDKFRIRGATAFNNDGWWNALATAEGEFDIFALAIAGEAMATDEYGFAISGKVEISETVTLNLASRTFVEADNDTTIDTLFEVETDLSESITLLTGAGYVFETDSDVGITYAALGLEWSPNGDFETELGGRVHSQPGEELGYELSFNAVKSFQ